jgi:hypothetical protein
MDRREQKQLIRRFQGMLDWIARHGVDAKPGSETEFFQNLRTYVLESQRQLSSARSRRDIARLRKRADKADRVAISYVQSVLRDRRMDES